MPENTSTYCNALDRSQHLKWEYIEAKNRKQQYSFFAVLFYGLLAFFSLSCFATDAPSESIKTFYHYITEQQCEKAIKLRPNYSIERCKKITKVHIHKVITEISDKNNAVLLLELDSFYNNKKSYFFGYVRLTQKKGQWLIVGPFKSRDDYWLDEYVKHYIPGKFKGLSKVAKVSGEKKMPPPGDSIDAEEFSEKKTIQTTYKTSTPNRTTNTTAITTTKSATSDTSTNKQSSISAEAKKFLSGHYPIEANYASLLKKIRQLFPTQATTAILLIDKSRRTLYAYNAQNLLLGALPILSSDNSSFPSGLYSLSSTKAVASSDGIAQQTHHPITLKRMLITDTKDNPLYYIRDFLDTDKNNSLQLSPIDSKKLQQFISSSAIAYIGQ